MPIEYVNQITRPLPGGGTQTGQLGLWNEQWYIQTLDEGVTVRFEVVLPDVVRFADDLAALRADLITYAVILRNRVTTQLSSLNATNYEQTLRTAREDMDKLTEVAKGIKRVDLEIARDARPPIIPSG